ncbi:MAG: ATP-binding cassette domain-containing protein [Pseudomonadota bacterium]
MVAPRVEISEAVVERGRARLLGPVTCAFAPAPITAVMGPNGAGKTSFLKLLHGLERPRGGQVQWAGATPREQSYVPQRAIVLRRSVRENLALPLKLRGQASDARVAQSAERLGLTALLDTHAPRLSGGEAQRLALARALITGPKVLFLDEPTANLDVPGLSRVEEILVEEAARGTRILLCTHGVAQARRLADAVIWVAGGQVHAPLGAAQFFSDPPDVARQFLELM